MIHTDTVKVMADTAVTADMAMVVTADTAAMADTATTTTITI